MTLDRKTVTNLTQFKALEHDWEALRRRNLEYGFCLSWHWLYTWCEYYLKEKDCLFIQLFYLRGNLVAIIPTYLKKLPVGFELRFIATGEDERAEVCSEFQDFIIEGPHKQQVCKQFFKTILATEHIKSIEFNNILPEYEAAKLLNSVHEATWTLKKCAVGQRFIENIYASQQQQLEQISGRSNRRKLRKVIANNRLIVNQVKHLDDFPVMFEQLVELHQSAWQQRGKIGAFTQPEFFNFHMDYAKYLLKNNRLMMFNLVMDNEVVAVFYGIIDGKNLSYYQSGIQVNNHFDGIGVAMHFQAMDFARQSGLQYYDLMRGHENSYKKQLTEGKSIIFSHSLQRKEVMSSLINKLFAALKIKVNQLSSIYGL